MAFKPRRSTVRYKLQLRTHLSIIINTSVLLTMKCRSVYPGVFPGFAFLRPRAAGRALQVAQRLSEDGGRCLLSFGGGGRGEMQIAAADRGRACAGVCSEEAGTSLLHFSPPARPTDSSQVAGRRLSAQPGCRVFSTGILLTSQEPKRPFAPFIARQFDGLTDLLSL